MDPVENSNWFVDQFNCNQQSQQYSYYNQNALPTVNFSDDIQPDDTVQVTLSYNQVSEVNQGLVNTATENQVADNEGSSEGVPDEIFDIIDDLRNLYPLPEESQGIKPILASDLQMIEQQFKQQHQLNQQERHQQEPQQLYDDQKESQSKVDYLANTQDFENNQSVVNCNLVQDANREMDFVYPVGDQANKCLPSSSCATSSSVNDQRCEIELIKSPLYVCTFDGCNKAYNNRRSLNIHFNAHTKTQPYMCPVCGKRFNEEGFYRRHCMVQHNLVAPSKPKRGQCAVAQRLSERRKYTCHVPGCGKFFYKFPNLQKHHEIHLIENRQIPS